MKSMKYIIPALLFSATAFAGNDSGVGTKGKTAEEQLLEGGISGGTPLKTDLDDLLGAIKSDDLLKGLNGRIQIPMSEENIRRLKLRASVTGTTPLTLTNGERFLLQRDLMKDRLIDVRKTAEVVEKAAIRR